MNEVKGIVSQARPVVEAFGVEGPGESGMDVSWPYFDGDIDAIVDAQTTEKSEVNSVRIDIKKGTADLATLSAASDISYQLLTRSSPSYQEAHDRIMFAAYGAKSNAVAALSALAAATGTVEYDAAAADGGQAIRAALLEASVKVELATGLPASFVLAGTAKFVEFGSAASVWPSQYGTQNATGTGDAATLSVNLSGLPVLHARHLGADEVHRLERRRGLVVRGRTLPGRCRGRRKARPRRRRVGYGRVRRVHSVGNRQADRRRSRGSSGTLGEG